MVRSREREGCRASIGQELMFVPRERGRQSSGDVEQTTVESESTSSGGFGEVKSVHIHLFEIRRIAV